MPDRVAVLNAKAVAKLLVADRATNVTKLLDILADSPGGMDEATTSERAKREPNRIASSQLIPSMQDAVRLGLVRMEGGAYHMTEIARDDPARQRGRGPRSS